MAFSSEWNLCMVGRCNHLHNGIIGRLFVVSRVAISQFMYRVEI